MPLQAKLDQLKTENTELLERRKSTGDDTEDLAQERLEAALSRVENLEQETHSLKMVMELRNEEINKLKNQTVELEHEVQENRYQL